MYKTMNELFFELIQVALGKRDCLSHCPTTEEWQVVFEMTMKQNLVGVCFAALRRLSANAGSGLSTMGLTERQYLTWMGMAARIQQQWEHHETFIARLADFYQRHGIDMMLLKGYGLSLNYPEAKLRIPGDVDVYLSDNVAGSSWRQGVPVWKKADDAIRKEFNVEVRNDSEHHTTFTLDGIMVENHYDFVNTRIRRSSQKLEKVFKELAKDKSNVVSVKGMKVYLPSDRLNAVFLLRHCAGHFASEGITLRNVLDWGLFVTHAKKLDWDWICQLAIEYNMHKFMACLNAICIDKLGLERTKFCLQHVDRNLKERVLNEITNGTDLVHGASVWLRTKRWWQHRWKHRICYNDSLVSSFAYSVKANIMGISVE